MPQEIVALPLENRQLQCIPNFTELLIDFLVRESALASILKHRRPDLVAQVVEGVYNRSADIHFVFDLYKPIFIENDFPVTMNLFAYQFAPD